MTKITLTYEELESHLDEQITLLINSCNSFDSGISAEAKRIATIVRILYHNTKQSKSLLSQLNRVKQIFCTSFPPVPGSLLPHSGLALVAAKGMSSKYIAPLDDVPFKRWCLFNEWWNEIIFIDNERNKLSRKDIVLTAANQDGGAHVDPKLERKYKRLKEDNPLNLVYKENGITYDISDSLYASIRQVGHEVLKTLLPEYKCEPKVKADLFIANPAMVKGPSVQQDLPKMQKFDRNDPCPCGSGKKFKNCHGKH